MKIVARMRITSVRMTAEFSRSRLSHFVRRVICWIPIVGRILRDRDRARAAAQLRIDGVVVGSFAGGNEISVCVTRTGDRTASAHVVVEGELL